VPKGLPKVWDVAPVTFANELLKQDGAVNVFDISGVKATGMEKALPQWRQQFKDLENRLIITNVFR
jgi:hypothetical protein